MGGRRKEKKYGCLPGIMELINFNCINNLIILFSGEINNYATGRADNY